MKAEGCSVSVWCGAGQQGSRAAGQQDSRAAGQQDSTQPQCYHLSPGARTQQSPTAICHFCM